MHANLLAKNYLRGVLFKEIRTGVLVKVGVFTKRDLFNAEDAMTTIFPTRKTDRRVV